MALNHVARSTEPNRRDILKSTAGVAGASVAMSALSAGRILGANERMRVAVIGTGGQGQAHVRSWVEHDDVELAKVCDVDEKRAADAAGLAPGAEAVGDLRTVLDDDSITAVSIATPDHWHTPAALLALDAGKHVYVEKPCSHNVREGRLLVEKQRETGLVVQHGTQTRSSEGHMQAFQMLREGVIGDVMIARAWDVQFRGNIGKAQPGDPPAGFDYDTWVGPAPFVPFQSNRHHYTWHWWYDFGTGDAGNDGVHEIDIARWGLGVDTQPSQVAGIGGKYFHDDDQQFPDTLNVVFEYPGDGSVGQRKQLIFEMRLWCTNYPEGVDNGVEFIGSKGRMFISKRGKFFLLAGRNERLDQKPEGPLAASVAAHQRNFVDAIKGQAEPHADALTAHLSSSLSHLANLTARTGRSFAFDPETERASDEEVDRLLAREYREGHWAVPSI